jgi:hypothetical protein
MTMPGKYNIKMYQGSSFRLPITFYVNSTRAIPIDFSGTTWKMQIRESVDSENYVLELSNSNGRIDISEQANGKIELILTAVETAALSFENAVYDLENIDGVEINKYLFGKIILYKESTK